MAINLESTLGMISHFLSNLGTVSIKKLEMLLYLADREATLRFSFPITEGEPWDACFLLTNPKAEFHDLLNLFVETDDDMCVLRKPFPYDWLSDNDVMVLKYVAEKYGHLSEADIMKQLTELPEHKNGCHPDWEQILRSNGKEASVEVYKDLSTMLPHVSDVTAIQEIAK